MLFRSSDCSAPEIQEAYEEVRNDNSPINWMLITYKEGTNQTVWTLHGKGEGGLEELKAAIDDKFIGYGYLRVTTGDEMSIRAKFVFIKYISKGTRMNLKAKMNIHRGDVEKVINQISIAYDADCLDELDENEIMERVNKAGGAHYN